MKAVIQRVKSAEVSVSEKIVGSIQEGLVILLGIENEDTESDAKALCSKIAYMRIFCDDRGKLNLSVNDIGASVLVISNFTLCADTSHGRRPYFGSAASPEKAEELYNFFCMEMQSQIDAIVQTGIFGADMKISMICDGPVTIVID